MLKKRTRRCTALLLAALLLLGNHLPTARAEGETVSVSSAEELIDVVKHCSLDSWSRGRTILLNADLDLKGRPFTPFPIFCGVFDGQGHTISGLRLAESGSSMGLFRTVQEGAVVKDLTVAGTVAPSGSASQVGGIVGVNRGFVQNCSFRGVVRGEGEVGGIVGRNRESGEISGCSAGGQVLGSSATGGIAGRNEGVLVKCANSAEVNTDSPDAAVRPQDLDLDVTLLDSGEDVQGGEGPLTGHSDTGGVTGLSSGVVQSCVNDGTVGYPHVGYNVGGVAGRQSGYLSGCINNGTVYGRKDVGGIVGQAEPDIAIMPGEETLEELQRELNQLENLIGQSVSSADRQGDRISNTLTAMGGYTDTAKENTSALLDQTSAFADSNIEEINALSAAVTDALDRLSPALKTLADTSDLLPDICSRLEEVVKALYDAGSITQDSVDLAVGALDRMESAGNRLADAAAALHTASDRLQDAVIHRDSELERQALAGLSDALNSFAGGVSGVSAALSDLMDAIHAGNIVGSGALQELRASIAAIGEGVRLAAESIAAMSRNTEFNWDALEGGVASADNALGALYRAAKSFSDAMGNLRDAANTANGLTVPMQTVVNALLGALDVGDSAGDGLESAFSGMQNAVDALRRNGGITFTTLGEEFHDASSGLYAAAGGLSQEMENLHEGVDSARSDLTGNLQAINRQAGVVTNLLLDAITDLRDGPDADTLISDSSDLDAADTMQGKIAQCVNNGAVEGDRNVGGVAGAMAIEYDLDPEDDMERLSLGATYETRAVLQEDISRGTIVGKKDCVGGMVGRMDLGAVLDCESYSSVSSTSGSYVGGIAGWSESAIRESFAKCVLSGEDDVGGIAGWASKMRGCWSIATIENGRSRLGAIAGNADIESGGISGNRFLDTGTAGIDGVSYEGAAEPADFETLRAAEGIPNDFTSFTLKLMADGEVKARIPFQYGQDLSGIELPAVPEQEGSYGRWPEFDTSGLLSDITAEAVYTPWAALVASTETTAENGPSLALAEGQFTQDAALQMNKSGQTPPPGGEPDAVWEIRLTGTDLPEDAVVPLRLRDPYGSGTVWQYTDGRWQRVEAKVNGKYLLLDMQGLSGVFCVTPEEKNFAVFLLPAAALFLLALAAVRLGKQRRRKKKKSAETQDSR